MILIYTDKYQWYISDNHKDNLNNTNGYILSYA